MDTSPNWKQIAENLYNCADHQSNCRLNYSGHECDCGCLDAWAAFEAAKSLDADTGKSALQEAAEWALEKAYSFRGECASQDIEMDGDLRHATKVILGIETQPFTDLMPSNEIPI